MRVLIATVFAFLISLSACSEKSSNTANESAGSSIQLITYSSMVGEGSLGNLIQKEYSRVCNSLKSSETPPAPLSCHLILRPEDGDSSLTASFRRKSKKVAGVLGLSELQTLQLKNHPQTLESIRFSHSPYAFIANTEIFPQSEWPKTWKEVPAKLKEKVFLQDPRVSSAGIGLLKTVFSNNLITLSGLKTISKKMFPSWSLSYGAFQKGDAPVIWSYLSSEAYHLCEESQTKFKAIPLEEGYPSQEEWLLLSKSLHPLEARALKHALLSETVQTKIPSTNWMFPESSVSLPECYKALTKVKALRANVPGFSQETMQNWLDQWSL